MVRRSTSAISAPRTVCDGMMCMPICGLYQKRAALFIDGKWIRMYSSSGALPVNEGKQGGKMFRLKSMLLVLTMAVSINATAATKAIKFGKLWDGHKVIPNAVVIVDGDKITSVASNRSEERRVG